MSNQKGRPKGAKTFNRGIPQFIVTRSLHIDNEFVEQMIRDGRLVVSHKTARTTFFTADSVFAAQKYICETFAPPTSPKNVSCETPYRVSSDR